MLGNNAVYFCVSLPWGWVPTRCRQWWFSVVSWVGSFPTAAVTNHHTPGGPKHQTFSLSQVRRTEVRSQVSGGHGTVKPAGDRPCSSCPCVGR